MMHVSCFDIIGIDCSPFGNVHGATVQTDKTSPDRLINLSLEEMDKLLQTTIY